MYVAAFAAARIDAVEIVQEKGIELSSDLTAAASVGHGTCEGFAEDD